MERRLPATVAGATGAAVGTSKRGLFWGGDVYWGEGSPEAPLTREHVPQLGRRAFLHHSTLPVQHSHRRRCLQLWHLRWQSVVGALEAGWERAGAPRAGSEGKEVNKP